MNEKIKHILDTLLAEHKEIIVSKINGASKEDLKTSEKILVNMTLLQLDEVLKSEKKKK